MKTSKQSKPHTNHTHKLIKQSYKALTQIIKGVKVTLGYNPNSYFNLSILGKIKPYQTDARGYYDKSRPILNPLEWIKSEEGGKYMDKSCGNSEDIIFASNYQYTDNYPATIYTSSFYLWLGYLKHCINDINTTISAELYF